MAKPQCEKQNIPEQKIHVLMRNERRYEEEYIDLKDIYDEYPRIAFIREDIRKTVLSGLHDVSIEKVLEIINSNFEEIKDKYIVIDNNLKEYLGLGLCKVQYLNKGELRIYTINDGDIYNPDENTRKELIKQLVFDDDYINHNNIFIGRRCIPAIKDYEKIAVDRNSSFIQSNEKSKWKIISPISLKDIDKIKGLSKDEFIEYITKQKSFGNLVEYTLQYNESDNTSIEEIIETYKKLIAEFYDVYKK